VRVVVEVTGAMLGAVVVVEGGCTPAVAAGGGDADDDGVVSDGCDVDAGVVDDDVGKEDGYSGGRDGSLRGG
jgi:hypothetical protein